MALGPGKYDDLCTYVRESAKAEGAIIIVFNGEHGGGFSCQAPIHQTFSIPQVLRDMANQIEESFKNGGN